MSGKFPLDDDDFEALYLVHAEIMEKNYGINLSEFASMSSEERQKSLLNEFIKICEENNLNSNKHVVAKPPPRCKSFKKGRSKSCPIFKMDKKKFVNSDGSENSSWEEENFTIPEFFKNIPNEKAIKKEEYNGILENLSLAEMKGEHDLIGRLTESPIELNEKSQNHDVSNTTDNNPTKIFPKKQNYGYTSNENKIDDGSNSNKRLKPMATDSFKPNFLNSLVITPECKNTEAFSRKLLHSIFDFCRNQYLLKEVESEQRFLNEEEENFLKMNFPKAISILAEDYTPVITVLRQPNIFTAMKFLSSIAFLKSDLKPLYLKALKGEAAPENFESDFNEIMKAKNWLLYNIDEWNDMCVGRKKPYEDEKPELKGVPDSHTWWFPKFFRFQEETEDSDDSEEGADKVDAV